MHVSLLVTCLLSNPHHLKDLRRCLCCWEGASLGSYSQQHKNTLLDGKMQAEVVLIWSFSLPCKLPLMTAKYCLESLLSAPFNGVIPFSFFVSPDEGTHVCILPSTAVQVPGHVSEWAGKEGQEPVWGCRRAQSRPWHLRDIVSQSGEHCCCLVVVAQGRWNGLAGGSGLAVPLGASEQLWASWGSRKSPLWRRPTEGWQGQKGGALCRAGLGSLPLQTPRLESSSVRPILGS